MITQLIWILSLPLVIIISYQIIAINYKRLEEKEKKENKIS